MSTTVAVLEAKLLANTKDFDKGMEKSESTMTSLAKTAGKAGVAGAVLALGAAAKIGFSEFMDASKVTAQTNAVIKSTGGVANVTAGQINKLSGELLKKSGIDDEAIASGENMLLTFTNIRNEVGKGNDIFNQATKTALDLSVATGKDLVGSNVLLGKALNDPMKGLTALTRVGVTFDEGQKKQIKTMAAAGDTMGAQKLILAELNKEFGGSAEALGKTLPGQINIAKETINNFLGELVAKAIPKIQEMIGWLRDHWPEIRAAIQTAMDAVVPILRSIGALFVSIAGLIKDNWGTIGPILQQVARIMQDAAKVLAAAIKLVADLLRGDWSAAWKDAKQIVVAQLDLIKTELLLAVTILGGLGRKIGGAIKEGVVAGVTGTASEVWNLINNFGDLYVGFHKKIAQWGADIGGWIVNALLDMFTGLGGKLVSKIKDEIGGAAHGIKATITGVFGQGDASDPTMTIPMGTAVGPLTGGDSTINQSLWDELSLGRSMGLTMSSGYRPGAITSHGTPSDHGQFPSKAIDMAGSPGAMAAYFSRLIGDRGVKQAFYDPLGSIFGGMLSSYREGGHSDHVHVATYDKGGYLRPGWNLAYNGLGVPEPVGAAINGGPQTILVQIGQDTLARLVRNAKGKWESQNGRQF